MASMSLTAQEHLPAGLCQDALADAVITQQWQLLQPMSLALAALAAPHG
jgi:hypothetical protein